MWINVKEVTDSRVESVKNQYSGEFSKWTENGWQKCRLTPEQIQEKVKEQVGTRRFLEAEYAPLRVKILGDWNPDSAELTISVASGDDSFSEVTPCTSLDSAMRLLSRSAQQWAVTAESNL